MSQRPDLDRRNFLIDGIATVASMELGMSSASGAQTTKMQALKLGTHTSFKSWDSTSGHNLPQEAPLEFAQGVVDVHGS